MRKMNFRKRCCALFWFGLLAQKSCSQYNIKFTCMLDLQLQPSPIFNFFEIRFPMDKVLVNTDTYIY